MEPAGQFQGLDIVGSVDEHRRRATLAEPAGHDVEPGLPSGHSALRIVAAHVADDGIAGQGAGTAGQARLPGPGLPLGTGHRRAAEQERGVERDPFSADEAQDPLQLPLRPRVHEERPVPHLDAVLVSLRQPAHEAGESTEFARAERRRQLDPECAGPPAERLDRGQEAAEQVIDTSEAVIVGDRPRQLEHEPEVGRGLLDPRLDRAGSGRRVERRIALDGIAPACVRTQPLLR